MLGIGINYFDRGIFYLVQLFFLFFLFRVLCFLLFFPMEGWFSHGWAYQMLVWYYYPLRSSLPCHSWAYQTSVWYSPLRRSLPFWGPLALLALCAWGKAALPRTGCQKTTKGHSESSPFRLAASTSGVPGVLFPFFREDITSSPSENKRLPPSGENPKTHGAPAGQDSVPQGGSQGRARSAVEKSRIASQVINLSIILHVGLNNSE